MWDWVLIVGGYLFAAFFLRLLGGFNSAADAISGWGRRTSLRRIAGLRWVPSTFRPQRRATTSS